MNAYSLSSIIQLLNPDNTISAHRMLAHAIGMTETIIYSALISKQTYYSQNGMLHEGGWFYSTICDLQESTTYGAKAQKTAINHLVDYGLIECEYKGMPAKRFFRIINDTDKLMELIADGVAVSEKIVGNSKARISEKSQQRTQRETEKKTSGETVQHQQEEISETSENTSSCSHPTAGTCSDHKARTCSCPSDNKTKDNIKPKKENPKKNFLVIDQSIDQSRGKNVENVESVEKSKPMTFADVLETIGIDYTRMVAGVPTSERYFEFWNEEERKTRTCKLPYELKKDSRAFKWALRYLCGYSYYFSEGNDENLRTFFETLICSLAEMTEREYTRICGQVINSNDVIDRLNDIISRYYLGECFISFEQKWQQITENKEIAHPKAYLKSCLWNWICDYDLEDYENTSLAERQ